MDQLREFILAMKPDGIMPLVAVLALLGFGLIAYAMASQMRLRGGTRDRLSLKNSEQPTDMKNTRQAGEGDNNKSAAAKARDLLPKKVLKQASEFYAKTDPDNIMRIRQKLIRAGYLEPGAVGVYFVLRIVVAIMFFVLALPAMAIFSPQIPLANQLAMAGVAGILGYFMPNLVLSQKISKRTLEYRSGFPDFMDLMIVCADAGMSMESAIERISREITTQYPALAQNLAIITIELRAGRKLADALKSLSERLGLDEVRSFAVLLQQSKELGTSLSDTLRVFSEEMRHKRMSLAEEKAHALPAKMTIPVTVFILPVIMLIATIPVIVRLTL